MQLNEEECWFILAAMEKSDRGKFKQVLCNLLNNDIKFTNEGRAHFGHGLRSQNFIVQQWRLTNTVFWKIYNSYFVKKMKQMRTVNSIQQDLHCMDFVLQVDDTGKKFPKMITSLFSYGIHFFPAGKLEKIAVIKAILACLEEITKPVWLC